MTRNCLIVIDMQNDFLDRLGESSRSGLILRTIQLIDTFRRSGCPVIWIQTLFRADLSDAFLEMRDRRIAVAIEGTAGAEIDTDLDQHDEDIVVVKKRYSAFFGTSLDRILDDLCPDIITLAGVNTHACIRTTAIDAYQRDMRVFLASECIDSLDPEHARISMAYMDKKIAVAVTNERIADEIGLT